MRIIQGATIFGGSDGPAIDSPVSPQAVARSIADVQQAESDKLRTAITNGVIKSLPWPPPPRAVPVPVFWTIHNRWTGKYVCDMTGNEHPDDAHAVQFPSAQAALQFARGLVGKPITHALAQPPPENDGHCYKCGTANPRNTITCGRCQAAIDIATSWVQVHVYDAQGRWAGPTIYV